MWKRNGRQSNQGTSVWLWYGGQLGESNAGGGGVVVRKPFSGNEKRDATSDQLSAGWGRRSGRGQLTSGTGIICIHNYLYGVVEDEGDDWGDEEAGAADGGRERGQIPDPVLVYWEPNFLHRYGKMTYSVSHKMSWLTAAAWFQVLAFSPGRDLEVLAVLVLDFATRQRRLSRLGTAPIHKRTISLRDTGHHLIWGWRVTHVGPQFPAAPREEHIKPLAVT